MINEKKMTLGSNHTPIKTAFKHAAQDVIGVAIGAGAMFAITQNAKLSAFVLLASIASGIGVAATTYTYERDIKKFKESHNIT
jgi:hypothetical protein